MNQNRTIDTRVANSDPTSIRFELALGMSAATNIDDAIRLCLQAAIRITGMDAGGVYLVDPETQALELACHEGLSREFVKSASHFESSAPTAQFVLKGEPFFGVHEEIVAKERKHALGEGLKALCIVPIKHKGKVVACINVASRTSISVPREHRTEIELMATQIGTALIRIGTEESLRESEETFRSIVEASPMGIHLYHLERADRLVFAGANPAANRLLGVDHAQFMGKTIEEAFPPLVDTEIPDRYRRAARDGESWFTEQVNYDHGDIAGAFEVHAFRMSPGKIAVLFNEITARKRTEVALKKSEQQFRTLFEGSTNPIMVLDRDGTVIMMNPAWFEKLGKSSDECMGNSIFDLLPSANKDLLAVYHRVIDEGIEVSREDHLQLHSGQRWFWTVHQPLTDVSNSTNTVLALSHDITDRKNAEKERAELEKKMQQTQKLESLGVLAGGIAHDFNNLLMGMLGNTDMALAELPPISPVRSRLVDIETMIERATDLTSQLLAYSGQGRFVIKRLNLKFLVEEMCHLLEVSISKKVNLTYTFEPDVMPIESDPTQVRQIIMNLITNASEAIGDRQGTISVRTGSLVCRENHIENNYLNEEVTNGLYSYLEVADTGSGMDKETLQKIFDPFYSTKFTGRGLGLAAVLGIIQGHKGALTVESEVGKGTTFRVLFPATKGPIPKEKKPREEYSASDFAGKTMLLVDDEEAIRTTVSMMLSRMGFEVVVAKDGQDALDQFKSSPKRFDCVLLDLTMPVMDGEECFYKLQKIRGDVCVILSSGFNESDSMGRLKKGGVAGFVHKPYNSESLETQLRRALSHK